MDRKPSSVKIRYVVVSRDRAHELGVKLFQMLDEIQGSDDVIIGEPSVYMKLVEDSKEDRVGVRFVVSEANARPVTS